ncbi:MAG: prepilin-type N-terminal cleavage/methylation domain-containing protein [bacterium]|nr:prepilin-type N-terminal cleavage/methylation domain-containing protein [bacterium]MDT8396430.1 prepilin-type N-terminal cleavage/methylation domain-containing protein [bacterium]
MITQPRRRRGESGFTLLEVLAALSILGLSLLVLLQTDGLNSSRALHSQRLLGAVRLAGEQMEEVFSSGTEGLASGEGQDEGGLYRWERVVVDTEYAGLKEVQLTVRWSEGRREESYLVLAYLPE